MIIVKVIHSHSVLAMARVPIFYKAFQRSESSGTQILSIRHHPSQGVLRSCCCSSGDLGKNGERVIKYLSRKHKKCREKVRSHSFSGPAATRLLLLAHPLLRTQWPVLVECELRGSTENAASTSGASASPCLMTALGLSSLKSSPTEWQRDCPTRNAAPSWETFIRPSYHGGKKKSLYLFSSPPLQNHSIWNFDYFNWSQ